MRRLSFLLVLAMLLSLTAIFPTGASASDSQYVAEINGTKYSSLISATINLQPGETLNLLCDVSGRLIISKDATVNGNGHTLEGTVTVSGADVTVRELNVDAGAGTALSAADGASLSVSGGLYVSSGTLPTVNLSGDSTVNIYGGMIANDGTGRAVTTNFDSDNKINIYGGVFSVLDADACVCATGVEGGSSGRLTVYGGSFVNFRTDLRKPCHGIMGEAELVGGYQEHLGSLGGSTAAERDPSGFYIKAAECGLPELRLGADVRLKETDLGLRFTSAVSAETLAHIASIPGADIENITYGTLIAPTDLLLGAPSFSKELLDARGIAYLDLPAKYGLDDDGEGGVTFRAALTNVKEENKTRRFSAVPYMTYTVNGETVRIYGVSAADSARSIVRVASAVLPSLPQTGIQHAMLSELAARNTFLSGLPVADFDIVYPKNCTEYEKGFAADLRELIYDHTGVKLTLRDDSTETECEILVGKTARTLSVPPKNRYQISANGTKIEINAGVYAGYEYLLDETVHTLVPLLREAEQTDGVVPLLEKDITERARREENYRILKKDTDLRVIFHNVWGADSTQNAAYGETELRSRLLSQVYATYNPDVLCLQEYTESFMRESEGSLISLMKAQGYAEVEVSNSSLNYVTATPILYRPDKAEVVESGVYNLEGRNNSVNFVTWAVFRTFPDNQGLRHTFAVASVHLTEAQTSSGEYLRNSQISRIYNDTVAPLTEKYGCTVIVGGSFACTPDSAPYKKLAELGMTPVRDLAYTAEDSRSVMGEPTLDAETGRLYGAELLRGSGSEATDHVFTLRESEETVFNIYDHLIDPFACAGSDHAALMVELWFPYDREWTDPF
ncbi:MAG: hypothetical protein IJX46_05120 [Clostridia bacterium]|nr:hypothetical protein [Clostridia bacterium]